MELNDKYDLVNKAKRIKWFFSDIDGTLTDGGVYYSPKGEQFKRFSLRDGTGFFLLGQAGIKTGFITTECSPIVEQRANKLKIDKYLFGAQRKLETMNEFVCREGVSLEEIAFIGDELNDINLMKACGLSFAVGDADRRVKDVANIVCDHFGGYGAFREAAEIFLVLKGIDVSLIINDSL